MNKRIKKKKQRNAELELGNLCFGNSRGKFQVDRDWNKEFQMFLEECSFDSYGYFENDDIKYKEFIKSGEFENDIFIINPYYWGDDYEKQIKPNFVYKPTNLTISWYKYPFRDSYMNKYISRKEFKEILEKCKESFKKIGC